MLNMINVPPTSAEITNLLKKHGITSTLQRVEIAQIMLSRRQHLSAEQVLDRVNKGRDIVSKATVYNTLRLFAEKGLIKEIFADPVRVFYEPKTTDHYHFFNVDTGELSDIELGDISVSNLPEPPKGSVNVGVDVIIRIRENGATA